MTMKKTSYRQKVRRIVSANHLRQLQWVKKNSNATLSKEKAKYFFFALGIAYFFSPLKI